MQNIKKQSTVKQRYFFYGLSLIGAFGVLRNFGRMSTKGKQYAKFRQVIMDQVDANEISMILEGQNLKKDVILQTVLPKFKEKYFECAQDKKIFKSLKGNFFENLEFQHSFEGFFSTKKKEYRIQFQMNRPYVSLQLIKYARQLDKNGTRFIKNYPVTIYGTLEYIKKRKKAIFDTKMLAFDGISMVKYYQINIISIALSTFFYSLFLGAALAMYLHASIIDQEAFKRLFQFTSQKQIHECQFYDNLPL